MPTIWGWDFESEENIQCVLIPDGQKVCGHLVDTFNTIPPSAILAEQGPWHPRGGEKLVLIVRISGSVRDPAVGV